ncbi:hypothetical protein C5167_023056 [Papaver somniferum]|uniref:Uncharacterized protein n=1 Tax=Papaver somniferum TaxID=3469 RepID=A0A4Y7JNP9_PAPSO|nr:hypothetical protein C5167_023056 [Papaver somniferum]
MCHTNRNTGTHKQWHRRSRPSTVTLSENRKDIRSDPFSVGPQLVNVKSTNISHVETSIYQM